MKEFIVRRFSFRELDKEGQEKAIEQEVAFSHETMDSDIVTEIMMDTLANKVTNGQESELDDLKLLWSLGYSQGDGVAFTGSITSAEARGVRFPTGVGRVKFTNSGHYTHHNSFSIEYFDTDDCEIYSTVDGSEAFREYWQDMSRELERKGYAVMEDLTSESRARESLMEDDDNYVYLESGLISPIRGEVVFA